MVACHLHLRAQHLHQLCSEDTEERICYRACCHYSTRTCSSSSCARSQDCSGSRSCGSSRSHSGTRAARQLNF